jgi:hypothetical protein
MNSKPAILSRLNQALSAVLLIGLLWLGSAIPASATPNSALIAKADGMSKLQLSDKADRMKGAAKGTIDKAQSSMEDSKGEANRRVKDGMTEGKIAVESNVAKAENEVSKAADGVKGLFGK